MVQATLGKARLAGLDKDAGGDEQPATPVRVEISVKDARVRNDNDQSDAEPATS